MKALVAAVLMIVAMPALAQTWPSRPVRIVIIGGPGSPADLLSRLVGEQLQRNLGQPFVVEYRLGAGGNIGAEAVAKAFPDGYTLGLITDTLLTVNPLVYQRMPVDPWKDLVPVTLLATFSQTLVCNASVPAASLRELIDLAGRRRLTYGHGGFGIPAHLAMEMLLSMTSVQMAGIPYKGPAPAIQAVLAGEVDCGFLATASVLPLVKAGKLRALAVSAGARSPVAPDIPTAAEAGVTGYEAPFYLVLFAPAQLPAELLNVINREFVRAASSPEVKSKAGSADIAVLGTSKEDAEARLKAIAAKWAPVVQRTGMKVD